MPAAASAALRAGSSVRLSEPKWNARVRRQQLLVQILRAAAGCPRPGCGRTCNRSGWRRAWPSRSASCARRGRSPSRGCRPPLGRITSTSQWPNGSSPTLPMKALSAPSRAAATATLAGAPPGALRQPRDLGVALAELEREKVDQQLTQADDIHSYAPFECPAGGVTPSRIVHRTARSGRPGSRSSGTLPDCPGRKTMCVRSRAMARCV